MRASYIAFIGRHSANVVGMFLHEIGVEGSERLPHFERVLLVDAEDNGLGDAIGFGHEPHEVSCNSLRSCTKRYYSLKVPR